MKKLFTILVAALLTATLWAQSPEKMSYQAVIRNATDNLVTNTNVGMRIQILQTSEFGAAVYVETHSPTTNTNGLVSIEIGEGSVVTGDFKTIDWAKGPYFIKTETDPAGGTNYTITGTSQILSVPYALHAKTAETVTGGITETDPLFTSWDKSTGITITESQISDLQSYLTVESDPVFNASPAKGITGSNITNWNTAFGWGNHAGLYKPISYVPAWAEITSKPTTLAGYSITDAMSISHPANSITGSNITNWNTAFGWGNHAGLYRPVSWVPSWNDVTGKPTTFTPSAHLHSAVDITSGTLDAARIPTLDIGTKTSGTLSVARGGTGTTTFTSGNVLIGSGTGAINTISRSGIDTRASFPPDAHSHAATDITSGTFNIARIPTGTSSSTVALGNHTHGSITNTGSIGSTAGRIVTTGASGALQATAGTTAGQMLYWNGSAWINVAPGNSGQVLTLVNGAPTWTGTSASSTDVVNPKTGKIWMDRNLGATRVATSSTDANAYGFLYQWGRRADGHQVRTSGTTSTLGNSDTPGHGNFILATSSPYDWRSPQNTNLWQGVSGVNNPCTFGYRLPTSAEWSAEILSWNSNNADGAYASPLKLPVGGYRDYSNGTLTSVNSLGYYWSSTIDGIYSLDLAITSSDASIGGSPRAYGESVRCIKE
jgi:hypothetical protein